MNQLVHVNDRIDVQDGVNPRLGFLSKSVNPLLARPHTTAAPDGHELLAECLSEGPTQVKVSPTLINFLAISKRSVH